MGRTLVTDVVVRQLLVADHLPAVAFDLTGGYHPGDEKGLR
jgi:hypothetical protein